MSDELLPCKKCGKTDIGFIENKLIFSRAYFCTNGCDNIVGTENHSSIGYSPDWKEIEKQWNEANAK